jgi:hypothetical protein
MNQTENPAARSAGPEELTLNDVDNCNSSLQQIGLYDEPRSDRAPIFAKRYPRTSKLAPEKVTANGFRSQRKRQIVQFLRTRSTPITSAELALAIGIDHVDAARRLPDVATDNLVGGVGVRRCTATRRQCTVWALRPEATL